MSQEELARLVEVSTKAVYAWEQMGANNVRGSNYRELAKAFGMTPEDLDREWRANKIEQSIGDPVRRGIPLINKAPAGEVVDYHECSIVDSGQGFYYVGRDNLADPNAFGVIVTGDSMQPTLQDGAIAIFSPMDTDGKTHSGRVDVPEGHILYVRFGADSEREGCTIARWHRKGKKIRLVKENKKYKAIEILPEEVARMAALVRYDLFPGVTKIFAPNEQLETKGDGDSQKEGQVFPDYEGGS